VETDNSTQEKKIPNPLFRPTNFGNPVLIGFFSGPGSSGWSYIPGEVVKNLGYKDIRKGGADTKVGEAHFYVVREGPQGSEQEVTEFQLAFNPLDLKYTNNGFLMDEDLRSFYGRGAKVLVHVEPYDTPQGSHRISCFLPGLITEKINPSSVTSVGYKLSTTGSLESLFEETPRLFKVSLDEGGDVFQYEHKMVPDPNNNSSHRFYSETFPELCKKYFNI